MSKNAKIAYVSLIGLVGLIVLLVGLFTPAYSFLGRPDHSNSLLGWERYPGKILGNQKIMGGMRLTLFLSAPCHC
jgi:hypothetical protein